MDSPHFRVTGVDRGSETPEERHKSWVAVACSDGAVRLVDTSPQRAASVVRTSYAHGVEATAVAISREGTKGDGGWGWK